MLPILDQGLVSGSNFLLAILLTRVLGLEQFGLFTLCWMAVLFVLGLHQAMITKPYFALKARMDTTGHIGYYRSLHILQLGICLGAGILTFLILLVDQIFGFFGFSMSMAIAISCAVCLFPVYEFYRKSLFSFQKIEQAFVLDTGYVSILFGVLAAHTYFGSLSVEAALWSVCISSFVACLVGHRWCKTHFEGQFQLRFVFLEHLRYSKWLTGTAILQWFGSNFFILALAAIMGNAAVGAVRMIQNIMGILHVLFLSMENVVPLQASRFLHKSGVRRMHRYLLVSTRRYGVLVGAFIVGLLLFGGSILNLLYGSGQSEYAFLLSAFACMYILVYLSYPMRFGLRSLEKTRAFFTAYVVSTLFSFLAAFPLIEWAGWSGFIVGLFLVQIMNNGIFGVAYFKEVRSEE